MKKFLTLLTLLIFGVSWSFAGADFTYEYDEATQSLILSKAENVSGDVVIPESAEYDGKYYPVTSIGDSAFSWCTGLTSVTIPASVTSIEENAFFGCSGMTSLVIGNSVTSIGGGAFCYCTGLTSVTIPDSVTSIGNYAFYNCSGLTSVTIPDSVTSIGEGAFNGCTGLISVTIPDSVTSIGEGAFNGCTGLISVTIPDSVTSIGDETFYNCYKLTSVTIGNSVTSIGENAFYWCSGLTSVAIPESVTSIGDRAFYNCSGLTSMTIPESVTSIGDEAFYRCKGLTSIEVNSGNPMYVSLDGVLFNKDLTTLIQFPGGKEGDYIIPESVTSIGDSAFESCDGLTSVTIPESVTSIGDRTFAECSGLASVTIPESVTSIGDRAFYNCYKLTSVTIPDSVTSIGNSAFFRCSGLTSVTIPNSVTSIGDYAFGWCFDLTSVTIGNSVISIGKRTFSDCSSLKDVYCLAENPPFCDADTFIECNEEAILYVQATSLDDYIDASNDYNSGWSFFRDRIYSYNQLAEELIIDPTELVAYVGDSLTIKATLLPENANDKRLAWESSDENVAVVSQEGLVSILSNGECDIIVRTVDGSNLSAVCRIMVRTTGIEGIDADENAVYEVYSLNGVLIDPSADAEAIRALAPGIYILRNEKGIIKLIK